MRIDIKQLCILVFVPALAGFLLSCGRLVSTADQQNCKQQLRSLGAVIALYRDGHTNEFPPDLQSLDKEIAGRLLACPGARAKQSQSTNVTGPSDYFYNDWSRMAQRQSNAFSKYPMAYDRRLSNHDGRGVNVLMLDGSVEWDQHAEGLKKFGAEHPDFKIPIPE
jgi:prepilin-type processing-associated H-X9-DG protein